MSALSTTMYQNSLLISLGPRAAFTRTTVILDREDPARRFPGRQWEMEKLACAGQKPWLQTGEPPVGVGACRGAAVAGPPAATPPWLHLSV